MARPTLKKGDRGNDVKLMQERLNLHGHNAGKADGAFGKMGKSAVMSFQKTHGLEATGVCDIHTWAALMKDPPKTGMEPLDTGDLDVSEVYHGDMVSTAIGILNSMVDADPEAMTALCEHRVHCNAALGDHPTVQVTADCEVGLLGVLNGLFGVIPEGPKKGWGYITAVYDGGVLQRFRRTDEAGT